MFDARHTGRMSTTGQLLVAAPLLDEPTFDRTVIYMLEHNANGALGLVVNRPTVEPTPEALEAWTSVLADPPVIFGGGPVETHVVIGVAQIDDDVSTVDLTEAPHVTVSSARLFRGYSGWSPGQLDAELDQGSWLVVPAMADDVFNKAPAHLWREVLRRQGGQLAWLATAPDDLSMN